MLTPLDIQNKEFKTAFRGYKEAEVDRFLDEVIMDYEKVYRENLELKDKLVVLADQIKQYEELEETLKETLVVAQSTADELASSSRQKSKLIIEEAEAESRKIINRAYEEVRDIEEQYKFLKKEIFVFKTKFKSFIESQLITIEDFYDSIEEKEEEKSKTDLRSHNEEENKVIDSQSHTEEEENLGA